MVNLQHKPENCVGKRKVTKETEAAGGGADHHGRGHHHGSWYPPWASRGGLWPKRSVISRTLRFSACLWSAGFALDLPSWAYWTSFATSLDLVWPQYLYFILTFWLHVCKSAIKVQKS